MGAPLIIGSLCLIRGVAHTLSCMDATRGGTVRLFVGADEDGVVEDYLH